MTQTRAHNRRIVLARRPRGAPSAEDFRLESVPLPVPGPGQVLLRTVYLSLDPYMRGRMNEGPSYAPPVALGAPMTGQTVSIVEESHHPKFQAGERVCAEVGWQDYGLSEGRDLVRIGAMPRLADALGVLGMPGLTAYVGLLKIAALKDGDIVFVSAAAGAVGQVVCQIAKLKGHTVIGSAGGAEKVKWLKDIGVDQIIDYKAETDLTGALMRASPQGIDVYFDNVGGSHMEAALMAARPFGRFALCGMISQYNATDMGPGVRGLIMAVGKQLRLEGFIVSSHMDLTPQFLKDMSQWIAEGKVKWRETVEEGIENAPTAFLKLFKGENLGKMLVKLS